MMRAVERSVAVRISGRVILLVEWMVLVALLAPGAAHAAPTALPIIVLKARVGMPDPAAPDIGTEVINDQFEAEGFAARPETIARILGGRIPRAGILDRGVSAAEIMHPIELGYDDWSKGLFADAIKKLRSAKERIFRNPGLLVTDTKNLDSTFKGLVALSLSLQRTGKHAEAAETMAELVRIFRTRPVSRADWGRPAEEYWRAVAKPILAGGTGQLYVTTGNDHAVVFVDGQIRGVGKAEVADLVPGSHRVLVQVPSTAGLQYELEVKANENTNLDASWDVDSALAVSGPWIGFVFATEAERNGEAPRAAELARRWGQSMVVVVGTLRIQGALVLIGTLYRASGTLVRSAATTLEGDISEQVRRLARYLADGTVGSGLKVISPDVGASTPALAVIGDVPRSTWIAKAVGGAGALTITIGVVEYLRNPYDVAQPGNGRDDGRDLLVGTMVAGSLLLGGGVYLWLRESQSATDLPAGLAGVGIASIAAGTALYFTSQEPGPQESSSIRDTATEGLVLGVSGLALTGVGLWLMYHDSGHAADPGDVSSRSRGTWVPAASIESSRAFVGLRGSF
jgi:hypothetical protein